jgi:hypothetical protein
MKYEKITFILGFVLTAGGLVFAFTSMDPELLSMVQYYYWHQFAHWLPILIHALPNLLYGLLIAIVGVTIALIGGIYFNKY